jgi:CBS domain-containing protein
VFYLLFKSRWVEHTPSYLDEAATTARLEPTLVGRGRSEPAMQSGRLKVKDRHATSLGEIMGADLVTISSRETLARAYHTMQEHRIHHLIITHAGKFMGVISDRDLEGMRRVPEGGSLKIEAITTTVVLAAHESTPIGACAWVFAHEAISSLPILNDDLEVVGIVTVRDLLRELGRLIP